MKEYTFFVSGMHCNACVLTIEGDLGELKEISSVRASLKDHTVTVSGNFGSSSPKEIAQSLTDVIASKGYKVSTEKHIQSINWYELKMALPFALVFIAAYVLLQRVGFVNLITSSSVNYSTAFLIGIVASVSTCMAVVGGLVLSMSANFAKSESRIRPHMLFHVGRLVSFFLLGGVIGALGSVFQLGIYGTFVIGLIVALVLLILGINLLDIFSWSEKFQIALPKSFGDKVQNLKKVNNTFTPLIIGVATFFLPCGFTQSMQIYTLSTGDFWTGAYTMFFFALGTLPVLGALSFGLFRVKEKSWSGIFFKAVGMVVIFFGLFNLINSLAAVGIVSPVFNI